MKKLKRKSHMVNVRIPAEAYDALRKIAAAQKRTLSRIIMRGLARAYPVIVPSMMPIIEEWWESHPPPEERRSA